MTQQNPCVSSNGPRSSSLVRPQYIRCGHRLPPPPSSDWLPLINQSFKQQVGGALTEHVRQTFLFVGGGGLIIAPLVHLLEPSDPTVVSSGDVSQFLFNLFNIVCS